MSYDGPCVIFGIQLWSWVCKDKSPRLISSMDTQLHQYGHLSIVPVTELLHQECSTAVVQRLTNHSVWFSQSRRTYKKMMLTVIYATCTHEGYYPAPNTRGYLLGILGWKTVLLFYEELKLESSWPELKSFHCLSQTCSWVNFSLSLRLNFILYKLEIMIFTLQHFKNYQ